MSLDYSSYNPVAAAKTAAYDLILAAMGAAIAAQALPAAAAPAFRIEIPADIKNGDFACNAAMKVVGRVERRFRAECRGSTVRLTSTLQPIDTPEET